MQIQSINISFFFFLREVRDNIHVLFGVFFTLAGKCIVVVVAVTSAAISPYIVTSDLSLFPAAKHYVLLLQPIFLPF